MSKIKALLDRKAQLVKDGRAALDKGDLEAHAKVLEDLHSTNAALEAEYKQMDLERSIDAVAVAGAPAVVQAAQAGKPFKSLGEQLSAIMAATVGGPRAIDPRLLAVNAAAGMNEGVPSEGGFAVQRDFAIDLFGRMYEVAQLASRVSRMGIGPNSNGIEMVGIDEDSRADGSRWGGLRSYWVKEGDKIGGSKPKLGKIEMNLEDLAGLAYATNSLMKDSVALDAMIKKFMPLELAFRTDDAIMVGTGAGQPLGIMNSGAVLVVSKEANQDAKTINVANILKMYSRMIAASRRNGVWLINQDIEPQLFGMTMGGTAAVPVYLPPGGLSQAPYGTLMGKPVIPVENCATLGTAGDIVFSDLSQYLMIDKDGIEAAESMHVRFEYNENTLRFIYRLNGQPMWKKPLTPKNGTNTLSPFVALETRG
jgi:HK97 family phage major capsid protein